MGRVKNKILEKPENLVNFVPENSHPVTMDSFFDLLNRDQRTTKTIEMPKSRSSKCSSHNHMIVYDNCDTSTKHSVTDFHEHKPKTLESGTIKRFQHPIPFFSEKKLKRAEKRINLRNVINSKF